MTDNVVSPFAAPATALAANTVAFVDANRASDAASTPFARSVLASVVGGLSSLAMVDMLIIAAMGSPKSPATGKPIAKVSGLRDFDGGARLYQAYKVVVSVLENIDADAPVTIGEGEAAVTVGEGLIRKAVVGFILGEADAPKALFGKSGLDGTVKGIMAEHAKATLAAMGVEPEADADADAKPADANAPMSIADRLAATLVAIKAMSDEEFFDNQQALAALSDFIDARWDAIAAATAPVEGESQPEAIAQAA